MLNESYLLQSKIRLLIIIAIISRQIIKSVGSRGENVKFNKTIRHKQVCRFFFVVSLCCGICYRWNSSSPLGYCAQLWCKKILNFFRVFFGFGEWTKLNLVISNVACVLVFLFFALSLSPFIRKCKNIPNIIKKKCSSLRCYQLCFIFFYSAT